MSIASKVFASDPDSKGVPLKGDNARFIHRDEIDVYDEQDLLAVVTVILQQSKDYFQETVESSVSQSYRAWQNKHSVQSKYLSTSYNGRSSLFVPKTRASVRKALAAVSKSLFSSEDVVSITPENEDDTTQAAAAKAMHKLLNMRLTNEKPKYGLEWYQTALGAYLDGLVTGVTVSKQMWEFQEETEETTDEFEIVDEETGEVIDTETETTETTQVVRDRPMVMNIPIDNILVDPSAHWINPAQSGAYFIVRYPMTRESFWDMAQKDPDYWDTELHETALDHASSDFERSSVASSREGHNPRHNNRNITGIYDTVWLHEVFMRVNGKHLHFWTIEDSYIVSKIQTVRESYPEFDGDRPYSWGVTQIDTHRIFPMSPVESWQPLQLELNDLANLRLDVMKRSISPLTKVKRGAKLDMVALMKRGNPNAVLHVNKMDDVEFEQTPGPSGGAYTETSVNNANFDELSGTFSTSSVQQSRQMNETVGGMNLMSGAANALTEFDVQVWVNTWVQPTVRQLVQLIQYYETDEKLVSRAGRMAQTQKVYGVEPDILDLADLDISVRVNVGVNALDPMQRVGRVKAALEMLLPNVEMLKQQGVELTAEAFVEEILAAAGFREGARFYSVKQEGDQQQPSPEVMAMMEEVKRENQKLLIEKQKVEQDLQIARMDNHTKLTLQDMKNRSDLAKQKLQVLTQAGMQKAGFENADKHKVFDARKERFNTERGYQREDETYGRDRGDALNDREDSEIKQLIDVVSSLQQEIRLMKGREAA